MQRQKYPCTFNSGNYCFRVFRNSKNLLRNDLFRNYILTFEIDRSRIGSLSYRTPCSETIICYYSHKNKDLIKSNKTKQARQSKQAIGGDLGFGLV